MRRAQLVGAAHEPARVPVHAQPPVDRRPHAELLHAAQGEVDLLLVQQAHELVAEPRRGEVADEVHGAAGARQVQRVLVHAQPVAALVADGAEDPRGVLDEAEVVEHDDAAGQEVLPSAEVVEEVAEGLGLERHRHGVDGEVAPGEVAADAGVLHLGQRARVGVRLGPGGGDVDAQPVRPVVGDDDRGAELLVRAHVPLEPGRQLGREGDAVALDRQVDVEPGLAQQQVADGAADEVAAAHAGGHGLDVPEQLVQAQLAERAGEVRRHRRRRLARRRPGDRAARDDAEDVARARRPRPRTETGSSGDDRQPADLVLREPERDPLERRLRPDQRHAGRHHRLDRRVPEPVRRGALQVGERDAPGQQPVADDADAAEAVAPAEEGGVVDRRDVGEDHRARPPGRRGRRAWAPPPAARPPPRPPRPRRAGGP